MHAVERTVPGRLKVVVAPGQPRRAWPVAWCLAWLAALAPGPTAASPLEALPELVRIGRLDINAYGTPLRLVRVEIDRRPGAPIAVSINRIERPDGALPLWASLRLDKRVAGWQANGVVASTAGEVVVRFAGSGLGGPTARLTARTEPLAFVPGGLQPAQLWPPLGAYLQHADGALLAALDWQQGRATREVATLAIEGLTFMTDYGPVGPIDGTIALDRLLPPRTAEPQQMRIQGLQLEPLARYVDIGALSAVGTLDADLMFSFDHDGRLYIDEGRLAARGPGSLAYRPDEPPAALVGQGAGVELLLQAVTDFRYEALTAIVSGYLDDEMTVALQLRGANPELYEGHPIELNVNLEAPIVPLVGAGRDALEVPEVVRRMLEQLDD